MQHLRRGLPIFIAAKAVSDIGYALDFICMSVFMWERTRSTLATGLVSIALYTGAIVGGQVGSRYGRTWNRRRAMIGSDVVRMAVLLLLCALPTRAQTWWLFPVVFLVGCGRSVYEATLSAATPVLSGDRLQSINSVFAGLKGLAFVIGMAAATVAVPILGFRGVFALDAATYGLSALVLTALRLPLRDSDRDVPQERGQEVVEAVASASAATAASSGTLVRPVVVAGGLPPASTPVGGLPPASNPAGGKLAASTVGSDGLPAGAAGSGSVRSRSPVSPARSAAWPLLLAFGLAPLIVLRGFDAFGSASQQVGMPIVGSQLRPDAPTLFVGAMWSAWAAGLFVAGFALRPLVTRLVARSPSLVFCLATIVMSVGFIGVFWLPGWWPRMVAALVAGIGDAFSEITFKQALQQLPDQERVPAFGFAQVIVNGGFIAGLTATSLILAPSFVAQWVLLLHGVPILLAAWLTATFAQPRRATQQVS